MNNSVIEYLLNNIVRVCIIAPNFQQTNLARDDILNKFYRSVSDYKLYNLNANSSIKFQNGSRIDFICTSYNGVEKIRGKQYDLMLFKDSYYDSEILMHTFSTQRGIYIC